MIYLKREYVFNAYRITRLECIKQSDLQTDLWPEPYTLLVGDPYHPVNDERAGVKVQKTHGGHIYGPLCGKLRGKFK